MLVSFVHGLVDSSYSVPDLAMMFWFLLGITVVIQGVAQREQIILLCGKKSGLMVARRTDMSWVEQEAQAALPLG